MIKISRKGIDITYPYFNCSIKPVTGGIFGFVIEYILNDKECQICAVAPLTWHISFSTGYTVDHHRRISLFRFGPLFIQYTRKTLVPLWWVTQFTQLKRTKTNDRPKVL